MIRIEHKFRPFSHLPGTECLVPCSDYAVQIFPTHIKIRGAPDVSLPFSRDFTVQMDLERNCVFIWGTGAEGYFRFKLEALEEGLVLTGLRGVKLRQVVSTGGKLFPRATERLFLGCTKAQDVELMRRRVDSREFGPMLFLLGQQMPGGDDVFDLTDCFLNGFTSLCMPHAYTTIRQFLIDDTHILPALPPEWHAGCATGLRMHAGTVDLEWTKGMIRRMVFHPFTKSAVDFVFPKSVRSFRRTEQNGSIHFDRFQK